MLIDLERGEGREREKKKNIDVREKHLLVSSCVHPNCDETCSPGMCLNWELNLRPFSLWDDATTNWATLTRARLKLLYWIIPRWNIETKTKILLKIGVSKRQDYVDLSNVFQRNKHSPQWGLPVLDYVTIVWRGGGCWEGKEFCDDLGK